MVASAVRVDQTNAAQLQAWDGDEGAYWTAHADEFDRSIAEYHRHLMKTAAIGERDRVLDIGCGTGQTTRDAARAAIRGSALGVDLSSRMLDHARRRAELEGLDNVDFLQADAQIHAFEPATFDVAISRTGAMFFGDRRAAFENIARTLAPGGRLVLVAWQPLERNEWIREVSRVLSGGGERPAPSPDAPGPFALSEPDRVRSVLSATGFTEIDLEPVEAAMWFGDDPDTAHEFVVGLLGWMLGGLDDDRRRRALDDLHSTLSMHATAEGVLFGSAAWVISAVRP